MGLFSRIFGRRGDSAPPSAPPAPEPPPPSWPELSPDECRKRIESGGVVVLDVRMPMEHQARRIAGSKLIPVQQLAIRIGELDPKASYVVHCEHGMRSTDACWLLKSEGFGDVVEMGGGLASYSGPTESGPVRA